MTNRQEALDEITAIAARHGLTPDEIVDALQPPSGDTAPTQRHKSSQVATIFGYIGGIFVFAGIAAFISMQWEVMGSAARIIVTLGSGFAAIVMALTALGDERYRRASTPLFLIAAALQPTGMLVTFHEYSTGGDPLHAVLATTTAMAAQYGAIFWKARRDSTLFITLFFMTGLFWTAFELLEVDGEWAAVVIGCSLLSVMYGIGKGPHAVVTPFWYFVGSVHLFAGSFEILEDSPMEVLYLAITCFMVYVSVVTRSRTLLLASTLAMLGYIGYFTSEHFANTLGWPIALIIFGLAMIGAGALAFRINRKYIHTNTSTS